MQTGEWMDMDTIMKSARHSFGCTVERSGADADGKVLVLRRRCAKCSIKQKWVLLLRNCMRVL